jgi:hypothetical protein
VARRFNYRRVKIHRNYTIAGLADAVGAHKHTVGRWIAAGLPTTDDKRPFLIHGADFHAFMKVANRSSSVVSQGSSTARAAARRKGLMAIWPTTTHARRCAAY